MCALFHVCFTYNTAGPSLPPSEVDIASRTSSSLLFSWKSPAAPSLNGLLRKYYLTLTNDLTGKSVHLTTKSNHYLFESLRPFSNYSLKVAAFTVDVGPYSDLLTVTTLEDCELRKCICCLRIIYYIPLDPTGTPQNVSAHAQTARSVMLRWKEPPPLLRNGAITTYLVHVNTSGFVWEIETEEMRVLVSDVRPYLPYSFTVAAINNVGQGPFSEPVSLITPEDGECVGHNDSC